MERILKQYESLKSYFRSEDESQPRFKRLHDLFEDPMTEVHLLFFRVFSHVLPMLISFYREKNH